MCYVREGIRSSRCTGPSAVGPRRWTTATHSLTSPCSAGRRNGRTRLQAGRGVGTRPGRWAGLPSGGPCGSGQVVVRPRNGRGSKAGTRMISERRMRRGSFLRIIRRCVFSAPKSVLGSVGARNGTPARSDCASWGRAAAFSGNPQPRAGTTGRPLPQAGTIAIRSEVPS